MSFSVDDRGVRRTTSYFNLVFSWSVDLLENVHRCTGPCEFLLAGTTRPRDSQLTVPGLDLSVV